MSIPSSTRPLDPARRRSHGRRREWALVGLASVVVTVALGSGGPPAGAAGFPDVGPEHRFAVPVEWAVWSGITTGYDDGTFRPTAPVSRQALAAFLVRAQGADPAPCTSAPFLDVGASHRFCAEIGWLVTEGIADGYGDGTFRPTAPVSRQAVAAFLYRLVGPPDPDPTCPPGAGPFPDVASSHAFCGEIAWLAAEGISGGYPDGTFRPTAPVSRQAVSSFLWTLAGAPGSGLERASVAADGTSGGGAEERMAISRDGRYVAFASEADDLVADDANGASDVFVRDLEAGTTELVSIASGGARADGPSSSPSLSADGRYVAFTSRATNLGPTGDDGAWDVFVHDRATGVTEQVSRRVGEATAGARGDSGEPVISGDGRFVAFTSTADDLVPGGSRGSVEVFVSDRVTGVVEQASVSSAGEEGNGYSFGPAISDDGNLVAFTTDAFDLVGLDDDVVSVVAVRDRAAGTTTLVSAPGAGAAPAPDSESVVGHVSADGSEIFFFSDAADLVPGDANDAVDLFVADTAAGTVERLAVAGPGAEAAGDSFLAGSTVSVDGRHVAFVSDAANLVEDDTNGSRDVFVLDRITGAVERISVTEEGDEVVEPEAFFRTAVSGDGRRIAFPSSRRLVAEDTDDLIDIYVRTRFAAG